MINVGTADSAAPVCREEAVPLDEPVLQRAGLRSKRLPSGRVSYLQSRRGRDLGNPSAGKVDASTDLEINPRPMVRQPIPCPGRTDTQATCGVQAQKPDAALVAVSHIGADVQLRKRQAQRFRQPPRPDPGHMK